MSSIPKDKHRLPKSVWRDSILDAYNIHSADNPLTMRESIKVQFGMYKANFWYKMIGLIIMILSLVVPYYLAQKYIDSIIIHFPNNVKFISTSITVISVISFGGANLIYLALYKLEIPFFEKFKDNDQEWPWKVDPDFPKKLRKCILLVVFNKFVCGGGVASILFIYFEFPMRTTSDELPSFLGYFLQIAFMTLTEDIAFYWSHRALHTPWLYKKIHKVHHEFYDSFSLCAEYAHPIEFIFGNAIPVFLGLIFLGGKVHLISFLVFISSRLIGTVEGHGGYDFPWAARGCIPLATNTKYHNYHHLKNVGNFASMFPFWDTIFGTNTFYYQNIIEYGPNSKVSVCRDPKKKAE